VFANSRRWKNGFLDTDRMYVISSTRREPEMAEKPTTSHINVWSMNSERRAEDTAWRLEYSVSTV